MCPMSLQNFGNSGNDFRTYPYTVDEVVSCDLAGNKSKEWGKCFELTTMLRIGQLRNGMDVAA